MDRQLLLKILIQVPALILAVSFHEAAHGWMANRLGDPTAKMMGRVSLNPIRHIDPVGSVIVPILLAALGGFMFGWAKPVPVAIDNLANPKRDDALVSIAGPASNFIQALAAAILIRLLLFLPESFSFFVNPLLTLFLYLIFINVILAVFNLIPIPPLDGSGVLAYLLPDEWSEKFKAIGQYGMFIILFLVVVDPLRIGFWPRIIAPIIQYVTSGYQAIAGIH